MKGRGGEGAPCPFLAVVAPAAHRNRSRSSRSSGAVKSRSSGAVKSRSSGAVSSGAVGQ